VRLIYLLVRFFCWIFSPTPLLSSGNFGFQLRVTELR